MFLFFILLEVEVIDFIYVLTPRISYNLAIMDPGVSPSLLGKFCKKIYFDVDRLGVGFLGCRQGALFLLYQKGYLTLKNLGYIFSIQICMCIIYLS